MADVLHITTGIVYLVNGFTVTSGTFGTLNVTTVGNFTVNGIAVTSTDGIVLANNTAATALVPIQQPPRLRYRGNVWNLNTVANNTDDWFIEPVPISAGSGNNPESLLKFGYSLNGAAATFPATLRQNGTLTLLNSIAAAGQIAAGAALYIGFTGRSFMHSSVNGQMNFLNAADTLGVQFKFDALPTVGSGFGTNPAVVAGSTPLAGSVDVGTGGIAVTGVITFGGTAFPSAPYVTVTCSAGAVPTVVVATTTQITLTTSVAWPANTIVNWHCISAK